MRECLFCGAGPHPQNTPAPNRGHTCADNRPVPGVCKRDIPLQNNTHSAASDHPDSQNDYLETCDIIVIFVKHTRIIDGNLFGSNDESGISEQKRPDRFPMRTRMCSAWVKPSQLRGRHCQSLHRKVHAQYIIQPGLSGSGCLFDMLPGCVFWLRLPIGSILYIRQLFSILHLF